MLFVTNILHLSRNIKWLKCGAQRLPLSLWIFQTHSWWAKLLIVCEIAVGLIYSEDARLNAIQWQDSSAVLTVFFLVSNLAKKCLSNSSNHFFPKNIFLPTNRNLVVSFLFGLPYMRTSTTRNHFSFTFFFSGLSLYLPLKQWSSNSSGSMQRLHSNKHKNTSIPQMRYYCYYLFIFCCCFLKIGFIQFVRAETKNIPVSNQIAVSLRNICQMRL